MLCLLTKGLCLSNPTANRHSEALLCFEEALRLEPNDLGALSLKGYALDSLGQYREAIGCFDKILESEPTESNILINKGISLSHLGKYDEAIAYFDKVLDNEPSNLFVQELKKEAANRINRELLS